MKKFMSILICIFMIMALLPAAALAEEPSYPEKIKICNIELFDGDYLASNSATSASENYKDGDEYVALYKDGVLKLNGIDVVNNELGDSGEEDHAIYWSLRWNGGYDLVIELAEGTTNNIVDKKWSAINGAYGSGSAGPSVTIQGKGTLNVEGGSYGIWVWHNIIIQKGATVNVKGGTQSAICNNTSAGSIIIGQGTTVNAEGGKYGVESDNGAIGKFVVMGGNLTVKGNTAVGNKITEDFGGNTVYVSNNVSGEGSSEWDGTSSLKNYKYLSLSGFSNKVTTYSVNKAATENGSIEVDFPKSMADETITVTATPDAGYELDTVTVADESGNVAVKGEENKRTFTMPAADVTVSATFKSTVSAGDVYGFAYDVQRSPAFPEGKGAEITLRSFDKPLNRSENKYSSSEGPWNLTEVGVYSEKSKLDPAPKSYLDGVVSTVANNYKLGDEGKAGMHIHKLTDKEGALVAYGVVIGVDKTNGYVLFVGDLWGNGGAGYLLSTSQITENSITFNTEEIVKNKYSISVDSSVISFADAVEGYETPEEKTVTITNTGDTACGALTIALSGGEESNFVLSKNSISDIASGSDTFTVSPKAGLLKGTYTETIKISGEKIMPETVEVSFAVTEQTAESYEYTVYFDANNGEGEMQPQTIKAGEATALSENTFTKDNYTFEGWNTAMDGTATSYEDKEEVTDLTTAGGSITLYAQWAKKKTSTSGNYRSSYFNITFNSNGGSKVPGQRVRKNSTLVQPENPTKEGFTFAGWYTDMNFEKEYDFSKRVSIGFTLYAKWIEGEGAHICPSKAFSDLDVTKWYHEDTDYVIVNDIMVGVSETEFAPEENLTRAMLVTILYRSEGEPATNRSIPFSDIDLSAYYGNAVIWAQQNGIVRGISETEFAPENSVTREQLSAIMFRYAQFKGMDAVTLEENLHFEDASDISEYAVSAMNWGVGKNYIFSRSEDVIEPGKAATRAEVAAFIHRYMAADK